MRLEQFLSMSTDELGAFIDRRLRLLDELASDLAADGSEPVWARRARTLRWYGDHALLEPHRLDETDRLTLYALAAEANLVLLRDALRDYRASCDEIAALPESDENPFRSGSERG
jgi:hypothetical protein